LELSNTDIYECIKHHWRIRHPNFTDVSFVPERFEADKFSVTLTGKWYNERYQGFCTDTTDSIKVLDLDKWHAIKE